MSFFVALASLLRGAAVLPSLVVIGQVSIQGCAVRSRPQEVLQSIMDNGARRALIPWRAAGSIWMRPWTLRSASIRSSTQTPAPPSEPWALEPTVDRGHISLGAVRYCQRCLRERDMVWWEGLRGANR